MLEISDLRRGEIVLCSENKEADQLSSYCEADLHLCFSIGKISHDVAQIILPLYILPNMYLRKQLLLILHACLTMHQP